jgi:chromosome segregation ATPase
MPMKFLQEELSKLHARLDQTEQRLDRIDTRLSHVEQELADVKKVVRESSQDILENQVEAVVQHRLHEAKITLLEAGQLKLTSTVLDHGRRLEKLEKSIDGK